MCYCFAVSGILFVFRG